MRRRACLSGKENTEHAHHRGEGVDKELCTGQDKQSASVRQQGVASRVLGHLLKLYPALLKPLMDSMSSSGIYNESRTGREFNTTYKVIRVKRDNLSSRDE